MRRSIIPLIMLVLAPLWAWAASDSFPAYEAAPAYTTYFADGSPNNVYHIRTTGSDSTGDGTYANAWASLAGAQGTAAAGDLILFHEGTYSSFNNGDHSWFSTNQITTTGTAADRIVIMAANKYTGYTSEAAPVLFDDGYNENSGSYGLGGFDMTLHAYQVLDGITFQGGLSVYKSNVVIQNCDFSIGTVGQLDGNPACIVFPTETPYANNIIIRNNTFHDPANDHFHNPPISSTNSRCYAVCMFESNTSDGSSWNGNSTQIIYNQFYDWNDPTSQEFIIYCKDTAHGVEIAYNRFYNSSAFATGGYGQGTTDTAGWYTHDNFVYNCRGLFIGWGEAISAEWYNNVVIDDGASFTTYGFQGWENSHACSQDWGQVWNNILYVDIPGEWHDDADATGYGWFTWVDYNAYASSAGQSAFENAKSGSTNWQQHDQTTLQTITVDGSYFATVGDSYPYKTSGRYADCIGGFTFDGGGGGASVATATGGTMSGGGTLR